MPEGTPFSPLTLPYRLIPKKHILTSRIEMPDLDKMTVARAMQGFTGLHGPGRNALAKLHMNWGANARNWLILKGYATLGPEGEPRIISLLDEHWKAMSMILHSPVEGLLLGVKVYTNLLNREWDKEVNGILEEKLWTPINNANSPETPKGDLDVPSYSHSTHEGARFSFRSGRSDLQSDETMNAGESIDTAEVPALTAATQSTRSMEQPSVPAAGLRPHSRARGVVVWARALLPEVPSSLQRLSCFSSARSASGGGSTAPTLNGNDSQT
jgi:hypothetical protein